MMSREESTRGGTVAVGFECVTEGCGKCCFRFKRLSGCNEAAWLVASIPTSDRDFFHLISFLDVCFIHVGCHLYKEVCFGADFTVPVKLAGYDAVFAPCRHGLDVWNFADFQSLGNQFLLLAIQFGLKLRALMPYCHVQIVDLLAILSGSPPATIPGRSWHRHFETFSVGPADSICHQCTVCT